MKTKPKYTKRQRHNIYKKCYQKIDSLYKNTFICWHLLGTDSFKKAETKMSDFPEIEFIMPLNFEEGDPISIREYNEEMDYSELNNEDIMKNIRLFIVAFSIEMTKPE